MIRLLAILLWLFAPIAAQGEPAKLLAAEIDRGWFGDRIGGTDVALTLDRAVPWRVFLRDDPWRLILDTAEVEWSDLPSDEGLVTGRVHPGWSRLVLTLPGPMTLTRAELETTGDPILRLSLTRGRDGPDATLSRDWDAVPDPLLAPPRPRRVEDGPLVIALDPGHGGVDPGAERGGATEAALMLRFANELAEVLRREGYSVVLTRDDDTFVGLRGRPAIARAEAADLMISLHADAIAGGGARGATAYTLSSNPTDDLSAELAARQGQGDLLLGVEEDQGDEVAEVLIDLARAETAPRSDALADALVERIGVAGLPLHKRPRLEANFTVLKAPDIPSVLLELGFMSDADDLANLLSPDWRSRMAVAIADGIAAWAEADLATAGLSRR